MALQVDNPLWLLGFIPMAVVLFLYWKSNEVLTGGRKVILIILRTFTFTLIILALAGVQILWPIQKVSAVFVVDRSHSMAEKENVMLEQVNEAIQDKSSEDKAGIVSAGRAATVEVPLSSHADGVESFQTDRNPAYTNLASGLQLAGSLFSTEDKGRVVLMTDGNENIGNAIRQASYLNKQGYPVDVVPFSTVYKDDVALSSFDVPENVYLGEEATLSLTIESSMDTSSKVRIRKDGETIIDQEVDLKEGANQLSFNHLITTDGFHTFQAEIISKEDQVMENNQLSAFAETEGLPHVLIVEGEEGAAANLEKALDASAVQTETISPELLPTQLSNYLKYDSIIFSNVSAHMAAEHQMELIERAVRDFGTGFVMTGGNQSFGVGGYFKTPIETVLPVEMDLKGEKELPSLGLSIVLDKSGSMMGNKMALAQEAAARSVALLREEDTLGVTAFDGAPWEVVELGPIEDKEEAVNKIRSIRAGGGTDIFAPLSQSFEQMKPLELKRKHVILLTDGQSAVSPDYQLMIEEARDAGITLSTVAIGMEADGPLLEEMAELGGGRFYPVQNNSSIPTILSRETALVTQTYIEDDPFYPKLVDSQDWGSYFEHGIPQMNAYIATTPKGRAEQILTSEKEDPVLARWQYGLGKTVAWTSDVSGQWSSNWPSWENWSPLWNDIVTWTFPQYQNRSYQLSQEVQGNQVTLQVAAADSDPKTLDANLVNEAGEEVSFNLQPKAPGEYEGSFEASETGVYILQISELQDNQIVGTFKTGIVVPYSDEYTFSPSDHQLMEEIASAGGGQVIDNLDQAFSPDRLLPRYDKQDLFYFLLITALLLFMADVAVRRFRFNFIFLSKLSSYVKARQSKGTVNTKERSAQLSQLKQASKKKPPSPAKMTDGKSKKSAVKPKNNLPKNKVSVDNTDSNQTSQAQSREEKMARLLDAKNRRKK